MPPASRGLSLRPRIAHRWSRNHRNASISTPRNPRNFPTKAQRRPEQPSSQPQPESLDTTGLVFGQTRWTLTPKYLRDRPYLRTTVYSFLVTVPISGFLLVHFPFEPRRVTGPSMRPTINPDCVSDHDTNYEPTWVLVAKISPNTFRDAQRRLDANEKAIGKYRRGELVVYTTPHDAQKVALKRVVAVPGDTVVPLRGYDGGEEAVVVPYHHVWVEGDVNDRKKSVDSNYFGPISQQLIKGKVIAMWSPWWNIFSVRSAGNVDIWPARQQRRVVEGAVESASVDPNTVQRIQAYEGEKGERTIQWLQEQSMAIEQRFLMDEQYRKQLADFYMYSVQVAKGVQDEETKQRARAILKEMERVIGRNALREAATPKNTRGRTKSWKSVEGSKIEQDKLEGAPVSSVVVHEDERDAERRARETPAKLALKEMLEQKRQYGAMIDSEFEEVNKRRVG